MNAQPLTFKVQGSQQSKQSSRRTIALITDQESRDLTLDDQLLVPALYEQGFAVTAVQWDSKSTDWESFDLCILRSCWDYHVRIKEFLLWLQRLSERQVRISNPIPIVQWNYHKRYLKDLERRGIPIVPTHVVEKAEVSDLKTILHLYGWDEVIVKPCVSASSYRTHRVSWDEAELYHSEFDGIVRESGGLVQPFVPEVQSSGEWSFIFFDRNFSHAVLKQPKDGEYRSQESFGGLIVDAHPTDAQIQAAAKIVASVDGDLLYARVDMIQVNGRLLLAELELIEPSLFFKNDPHSALRFARAVSRRFRS